jgi:hypothetical protein
LNPYRRGVRRQKEEKKQRSEEVKKMGEKQEVKPRATGAGKKVFSGATAGCSCASIIIQY